MAAPAPAVVTTAAPLLPVRSGEFEGPLDLLLELVRRHQVPIESMPLADITRQYLDYLKAAQRASIDLGADFVYMAATLIQIKSRLLLPQDPALARRGEAAAGDEIDSQQALIARLRDHARARAAAEMLKTRLEVEETTWSRDAGDDEVLDGGSAVVVDRRSAAPRQPTLADLIETLGDALRRVRNHQTIAVEPDTVTVADRMAWLREQVLGGDPRRTHTGAELLGLQPNAAARCCTFLGLLELGRDGALRIDQEEPFGEVLISATRPG